VSRNLFRSGPGCRRASGSGIDDYETPSGLQSRLNARQHLFVESNLMVGAHENHGIETEVLVNADLIDILRVASHRSIAQFFEIVSYAIMLQPLSLNSPKRQLCFQALPWPPQCLRV
jgi:hypothetical protein